MKHLTIFSLLLACATGAQAATREELHEKFKGGWTDDALVELYKTFGAKEEKQREAALRKVIPNAKFPHEGRPPQFFDTLASYYDRNEDGKFTAAEVDKALQAHVDRYWELLRDSQASTGPHEELSADFRIKTWKMMQKIALLKHEMAATRKKAWKYEKVAVQDGPASWDKDHTVATTDTFKKVVCDRSKVKPVLVKFGSTQCADCMLLEYNQGIRSLAQVRANDFDVVKVWWGPNVAKEMDVLRKSEGANSSPHFVVYKEGKRYSCGFQFPDATGKGVEKCLDQAFTSPEAGKGICDS